MSRSPILHVWVGGAPAPAGPQATPAKPTWTDAVTVTVPYDGVLHWGVDGWRLPPDGARPAGTVVTPGAVESALVPDGQGNYTVTIGPFAAAEDVRRIDYVPRRSDGSWDNGAGQDYGVDLQPKDVWWDALTLGAAPLRVFTRTAGAVHLGVDGWQQIADVPLTDPDGDGVFEAALGPFPAKVNAIDFAIHRADGTWDNNGGADYRVSR